TSSVFHAPATTDIHTLSLHDALPIWGSGYTAAPAVTFSAPPAAGITATGTSTIALTGGDRVLLAGTREGVWRAINPAANVRAMRSEEHTSELQSRRDLVCRLLLEKKK